MDDRELTGNEHARRDAARPETPRPYRRTTPHITQEPIEDGHSACTTRDHTYAPNTASAAPHRRHMGVASSDPQYLPPTEPNAARPTPSRPQVTAPAHRRSEQRAPLHYDRYLQTPKPGKSIFTGRHDRSRRRMKRFLAVLIVLAIILAFAWFFVIR